MPPCASIHNKHRSLQIRKQRGRVERDDCTGGMRGCDSSHSHISASGDARRLPTQRTLNGCGCGHTIKQAGVEGNDAALSELVLQNGLAYERPPYRPHSSM